MTTAEGPRLDDQLCFALYAASNTIVRAYRPLLAELGLTYPQYLVMMVLWERDGVTVQDVAGRLDLPAHGLTPVIRRLVESGWVSRATDPADRRVTRLRLTPDGAALGHDAAAAQFRVACATGLDDADFAALRQTLHEVTRATRNGVVDDVVESASVVVAAPPTAAVAPATPATVVSEGPVDDGAPAADLAQIALRSTSVAAYLIDAEGRVAAVSPAAGALLHWSEADLVGRPAHQTLHHSDRRGVPVSADSCPIRAGLAAPDRIARADHDTFWRRDGAPVPVWWTAVPLTEPGTDRQGVLVLFDRQTGPEEVERSDTDTRLLVLGQLSELLGINDVDEGLRRVAALGATTLAEWCVIDLSDDGQVRRVALADRATAQDELDARLCDLPRLTTRSTGSLARVLRGIDGLAVDQFVDDRPVSTTDPLDLLDAEQAALFGDLGAAHAIVVPLRARDRVLGAMTWVRQDAGRPFSDSDMLLATVYGFRVGLWLDNARLYGRQKQMAETLQRSLLTPLPHPEHLELAARYLPASEGAEVGGDWYDAVLSADGQLAVIIGDVTGHDVEATARMGQLRNMVRFALLDEPHRPERALARVDAAIPALAVEGQATVVVAVVSGPDSSRALTWANAGHLPPLLIGPAGDVRLLETPPNLLLGVLPDVPRREHSIPLEVGSTLVLFTDGLVERRGETLDDGLGRLLHHATDLAGLPLDDLLDGLLNRMVADEGRSDDVALVALHVTG